MSEVVRVRGEGRLYRALMRDAKRIEDGIGRALGVTARRAVKPIQSRVPVAFGELRDSVHPVDVYHEPKTIVSAPHAGAVEIGTSPHTPNFDALLRWVKLRAMQGLTPRGRLRTRFPKSMGPTTPRQAMSIAKAMKRFEVRGRGGRKAHGRFVPIDSPEQIALRISRVIEKRGTKPHWYVRNSLDDIRKILNDEVKRRVFRKRK